MERRQGCLAGLLQLAFLNTIYNWLQENLGFGRGCSCTGMGCGVIFLLIFIIMACSIMTGTDWFRLF